MIADRLNTQRLQRLRFGHFGQQGIQALCKHTLAGAGRTHHQQVMSTGRGDLQCAFGLWLAQHFRQIDRIVSHRCRRFGFDRGQSLAAIEE